MPRGKINKCSDCGTLCDYRKTRCFVCAQHATKKSPIERLMAKTVIVESGCIEFTGFRLPNGYGRIGGGDGKTWLAHRMAWTCANGSIPAGMLVCHHCDNPPCVNIEHLFLGTDLSNALDKIAKGRYTPPLTKPMFRGEGNPNSKLTTSQVLEILSRKHELRRDVADDFGITPAAVGRIVRGIRWGHLFTREEVMPSLSQQ